MPYQRHIADIAGEMLPDGTPAYQTVIITVPRQNGKTTLLLAFNVERCVLRGTAQKVAYTAQTGKDAEEKMLDDFLPILDASPVMRLAHLKPRKSQGKVGIPWRNGSLISVVASTEEAGHGKTWDLGNIDEAFADEDDRREQSLGPAMITKPMSQLLICSTMGTDKSTYWNAKVAAGRAAVAAGMTEGIAYFDWGGQPDDDIDDPKVWAAANPAYDITINERSMRSARLRMMASPDEFRRAHLNISTMSDERVIPVAAWAAVQTNTAGPTGDLTIAIDVAVDRSSASIVVAGGSPLVAELVDQRPGTGWVLERVIGLHAAHGGQIVLDSSGPAASLLPELKQRARKVVELGPDEVCRASALFYDAVADNHILIRDNKDFGLDLAVGAAVKQVTGDRWRWARKTVKADVTPLMAASLAHWVAAQPSVDLLTQMF